MARAQADADREGAADDTDHQRKGRSHDQGVMKVQLLDLAGLAADKNDIHTDFRSNAVILGETLRGLGIKGRKLCRIR